MDKENTAHGIVPEYGAIFMSNGMTRTECFERKLFGLPSWLGHFVLQIKSGMILFLFDYEKRVLHGVFRAISDGAMNIVPHAYSSSGQQFPAQVMFSVLWSCNPLSENQFRNAIKGNYFTAKKFNFGLSKVQVHMLLSLFGLTKIGGQLRLRQLSSDSFKCSSDYLIDESQSVADGNGLILNGRLQGKLMEGATLPHYNIRNIIPSIENPIHYSHMDNKNLTCNSGCHSNAQIMMPNLHSQSDCMTSMPFQTSVCLENITEPSVTQSQRNVSCSDPNLLSLPTQEFENDGSLRRSIVTSEDPSHRLSCCSLFSYQNGQGLARQEDTKSFIDSVKVSSMPSIEHTEANHGHVCNGNFRGMHSDRERKGSVFSRLVYPSDESIQESNDYADHAKLFLDPSMDGVMSVLQRHHWLWEMTSQEVRSQEHDVGMNFLEKNWTSEEHSSSIEDSIDDDSNHIAIEIPFVNFKRRRKPCKVEDNAPTGGENVNVSSVQLLGAQQKRRKLIRPSFAYNELRDSGDANGISPSLQGMSKDSLFRERASQATEFPDIIWLVDDEDTHIGCETTVTAEVCFGSTRNGFEDRIASSNYISDLNITSKDLGVNESCSSTHKCSTSEDHTVTASQSLSNSGLCGRQEFLEGSELNTGNVMKMN